MLSHAKFVVPVKLEPTVAKVQRALERGDFFSVDLKKPSGNDYYRAKLDFDSRLLVRVVEHAGCRASLALESIEHACDDSRCLRGARVEGAIGKPLAVQVFR